MHLQRQGAVWKKTGAVPVYQRILWKGRGMRGKGLVHIYCGDGKGKTSAAIGLAVRAAGRGKKVLISRFLKTDDSGEVMILKEIPGITVLPCEKSFGFLFRMSEEQKKEAASYYQEQFEKTVKMAERYDLLILDEMMASISGKMVPEERVLQFLQEKPENLEVVLTGRNPSDRLKEEADYISEILAVRHPYEQGIPAREGIEY